MKFSTTGIVLGGLASLALAAPAGDAKTMAAQQQQADDKAADVADVVNVQRDMVSELGDKLKGLDLDKLTKLVIQTRDLTANRRRHRRRGLFDAMLAPGNDGEKKPTSAREVFDGSDSKTSGNFKNVDDAVDIAAAAAAAADEAVASAVPASATAAPATATATAPSRAKAQKTNSPLFDVDMLMQLSKILSDVGTHAIEAGTAAAPRSHRRDVARDSFDSDPAEENRSPLSADPLNGATSKSVQSLMKMVDSEGLEALLKLAEDVPKAASSVAARDVFDADFGNDFGRDNGRGGGRGRGYRGGSGAGNGIGSGAGNGSGSGAGNGSGAGAGNGSGSGAGNGNGSGAGSSPDPYGDGESGFFDEDVNSPYDFFFKADDPESMKDSMDQTANDVARENPSVLARNVNLDTVLEETPLGPAVKVVQTATSTMKSLGLRG